MSILLTSANDGEGIPAWPEKSQSESKTFDAIDVRHYIERFRLTLRFFDDVSTAS